MAEPIDRPYFQEAAFQGNDNNKKPKLDTLIRIASKTDEALFEETKRDIWLSAYADNNRGSDFHWYELACKREWEFRGTPDQFELAKEKAF